ncbi:hypothetical protein F6455_13560 [Proteobacteria bacterium 005FR1]|nr:hypothetical protein [Proteobacteria bacterium 005FR1]
MEYKNERSARAPIKALSCLLGLTAFALSPLPVLAEEDVLVQAEFTAEQPIRLSRIEASEANISLDGVLDEAVWKDIPTIDSMQVVRPDTLAAASLRTETRIFYNDRGIYVGVMNYQDPGTMVARLSSRDQFLQRDGYVLAIDPSGQGIYGYFMRISLGGSKTDATILPERQFNRQWDGPWEAFTAQNEVGWTAEMFIPWSMMALPRSVETRRIGIYTERQVAHLGEVWSWPALPGTRNAFLSGFQPFEVMDVSPKQQLTYYPFVSSTYDALKEETDYRVGTDIYWRPSGNMQLSATLNPDFGTVESDDVVVNLGAYETFFPEKRPFFLEGQDVFITSPRNSGGPFGPTTLLNTRRIGSQPDFDVPDDVDVVPTDLSRPTDLIGAGKFTGQSGNWRYGTLLAVEDDSEVSGFLPDGTRVTLEAQGRDYAVGRLLYEDTSSGGRRSVGWLGTHAAMPDYNAMVNGLDFHYFSADAKWIFDGQLVHSDVDDVTGSGMFFDINYRPTQGVHHSIDATYLDDKLDINDLGYVQRNDHIQLDYRFSVNESGLDHVKSRNRSVNVTNQWNTDGRPVRLGLFVGQRTTYLNNTESHFTLRYFPPRVDDRLSRGNGTYKIPERWSLSTGWESDRSRPVSVELDTTIQDEDLGETNWRGNLGFNWRPMDTFSFGLNLGYTDREGWLIHQSDGKFTSYEANQWSPELEMDYFITARQQLRFKLQWTGIRAFESDFYAVDQSHVDYLDPIARPEEASGDFTISRLSFQARYRWEIAPLSDLFFVYTRGGNLPGTTDEDFNGLLQEAWAEEVVDTWVLKLRYRLGG